jgi:pimeloyl-ACP methyl ester carboxylesterase
VIAPPNPLLGLAPAADAADAAYVASVADQIDGPVVLVGHSSGGALITVAGVTENVVGLVHVAAYALEEGESLGELQGRFPLSPLVSNPKQWTYPVEGGDANYFRRFGKWQVRRGPPLGVGPFPDGLESLVQRACVGSAVGTCGHPWDSVLC